MDKGGKFKLYIILILAIIIVVWLMFGNRNLNTETSTNSDLENLTGENIEETQENIEDMPTFEEDVMKDLEGFFGNNNAYEEIEGEYGFNSPENE